MGHRLSVCKTQSVVLCSSPVNVWGECKQRVDDDPNEDPNGIVEVGEAARYHGVEF